MRVGTISLTSDSHYRHNSSEKKREAAIPTEATSPVNDKSNVPEKTYPKSSKKSILRGTPRFSSIPFTALAIGPGPHI